METSVVYERYGKYMKQLRALGDVPLLYAPTLEEIGCTKAVIQSCYRDIKELEEFHGNIVDYFCYISLLYLSEEWRKEYLTAISKAGNDFGFDKRLQTAIETLSQAAAKNDRIANNFTRLFSKNEKLFTETEVFRMIRESILDAFIRRMEGDKTSASAARTAVDYMGYVTDFHICKSIFARRFLSIFRPTEHPGNEKAIQCAVVEDMFRFQKVLIQPGD